MGKLACGCRQRQSGNLQHAVDWQIKVTRGAIQLMQTRQTTTEMSETRLLFSVYPANNYGLYGMAGNVWEWCLDEYQSDFHRNSPHRNPIAGATRIQNMISNFRDVETPRVLRGGSLVTERQSVEDSTRAESPPRYADFDLGFRCVKDKKS